MPGVLAKNVPILLVEDDEIDAEAVKRVLKKEHITNPFFIACDGVEALALLTGSTSHERLPQPCLILLDINLPRMNGLELLNEIRKDKILKQNVVFILTTSSRESDKAAAYGLQAAGYILKDNLKSFSNVLAGYCRINEFL
jgi:CheY-like chemotaxis protein